MEHVKFNKTLCGVDLLLNVLSVSPEGTNRLSQQMRTTDFFQIIFAQKGEGSLLLNGEKFKIQPNSLLFISKGQSHSWSIEACKSFVGTILVFQDDFLNEFFSDPYFTYRLLYFYQTEHPLYLSLKNREFSEYTAKLMEIKPELAFPRSDSAHLIRSILYFLLIKLNRQFATTYHIDSAISLDNLAYEFRKLVEENIYTWQRIGQYTDALHTSRITLNKVVKAQFNVTATEFIKSKLLFVVKMKLMHSTLTIAEIAYELNFSEANHLTRLFKNKEGITPNEFRVAYQNGRL